MFAKALLSSAFAACVAAQSKVLFFTNVPNPVTDGEPQAITYSTNDTESPVTILLRQGQQSDLQTIMTLTDNSHNSQFIWTPPKSLPNGNDYALQITQANQTNYYGPFTVQGASPAAVSSAAANSTMTSTVTTTRNSTASMGTSTTMHRNTTMSSASLTKTQTKTKTTATGRVTTTNTVASTSGAGFQGTTTGSGSSPSNTDNAASSDFNAGSSLALAFGAAAALFYLA